MNKNRVKLLSHSLRATSAAPLGQGSFQPDSTQRVEYGKHRIGKPRQNWIHQTKKFAYVRICYMFSYAESRAEDMQLFQSSIRYASIKSRRPHFDR